MRKSVAVLVAWLLTLSSISTVAAVSAGALTPDVWSGFWPHRDCAVRRHDR